MAMKAALVAALVVVLAVMMMSPQVEGITCGQVTSSLGKCLGYLKGGPMGAGCCAGVKNLNAMAQTTPDKQAACNCIKSLANSVSGIDYSIAAGLPGKCGVNIPYKISPSTDCKSIK